MTAHIIRNSTMSDPARPWLEVVCMACWPHTDGHQPFGPAWKPEQRARADAECARHNAARHFGGAVAS